MHSIRNIIFDFGNVLINLDFDLTKIAYARLLTIEGAFHTRQKLLEGGYTHTYEKGGITESEFFQAFRDCSGQHLADADILAAWLALLQDIPAERLRMLRELRQAGYKLYMLSNINHSHATAIHRYLEKEHGISEAEWRGMFDHIYYSHEIGYRKPDEDIFEFMLKDAGIQAQESLFIDDLPENTAMAQKYGLHIHTNDPKIDITQVICELLA